MRLVSLLLLLLAGCSTVKKPPEPLVEVPKAHEVSVVEKPIRVIFRTINATKSEQALIARASIKLNEVIESDCARDLLEKRALVQTGGRTPEQVYQHLLSLKGEVPMRMYFKRFTSAVAYRVPPRLDVYFNRRFFTPSVSVCDWASTMAHEGLGHSLGNYDHDFKATLRRPFSVPYSLNLVFDRCCK
jgi:hypothetical protein